MRLSLPLLLTLVFVLAAQRLPAQPGVVENATIRGRVTDANGAHCAARESHACPP